MSHGSGAFLSELSDAGSFCEVKGCLHYQLFKEMLQDRSNMILCEFGSLC